ncbi:MAG: metalloregulator ArsR/SmtB family transcription factor [Marinosulfonomonas sp.]|nr:metalloregulator ArsR/SmtB family transcription factor [Marinosulfonomonas sp.]
MSATIEKDPMQQMVDNARGAADMLKSLSHEGRLMILCHLVDGQKSVTELEQLLAIRQSAVSQHLARLRADGLVKARRDGKAVYYTIAGTSSRQIIKVLHSIYCSPQT